MPMESATLMITMLVPTESIVPMNTGNNVIALHPTQSVFGPHPVITSLQDERRKAMGYEVIDVQPENSNKKKKVMTREKALQKVINIRVENEHMEKKLKKLDSEEESHVKQISKLSLKIQKNRQKMDHLIQQFGLKQQEYQGETTIHRIGRTIKEGWISFWSGVGNWIKENAAPVTAVGLAVFAIVGLLFRH